MQASKLSVHIFSSRLASWHDPHAFSFAICTLFTRPSGKGTKQEVPAAALRRVTGKERSISIGIKRWMLAGCLLLASFRCRRRGERRRRSSMSCRICRFRHGISRRHRVNQPLACNCDILHVVIVEVHCRATLRWQVLRKPALPPATCQRRFARRCACTASR